MSKTCPTCGAKCGDHRSFRLPVGHPGKGRPLRLPVGHPDKGRPHRCPVCSGTGNVQAGFYGSGWGTYSTSFASPRETCRTCGGAGIVWG